VRVHSITLNESAEFDLSAPPVARRGHWLDYVEGMCRSLEGFGLTLRGADLLISSDVPLGAGLSSSAALEVAVGLAVCAIANEYPDPLTLVRAAHRAETEFVGTQSGIMDQYVSVFAQANECLLIDCRTLTSQSFPLALDEVTLVVTDSGTKRSLASSEYNRRRAECREGVAELGKHLKDITALRDVSVASFTALEEILPEPIRRRCRHVVTEDERTLEATRALARRDFVRLGQLMSASHRSLRDDYEVTTDELDLLVDTALSVKGVLGSRMTGGGFGGCTITLLERQSIEPFQEKLRRAYHEAFAASPRFFVPVPSAGAREIYLRAA
jgi:galactokinase